MHRAAMKAQRSNAAAHELSSAPRLRFAKAQLSPFLLFSLRNDASCSKRGLLTCAAASATSSRATMSSAADSNSQAPARLLDTLTPPLQQEYSQLHKMLGQILSLYADAAPGIVQLIDKLAKQDYPRSQMFHDHFAFRTFGAPGLGIRSIATILEHFGYRQGQDLFEFPAKKLQATWFAPSDPAAYAWLPRIFVSELEVGKLSKQAQAVLQRYLPSHALSNPEANSERITAALLNSSEHCLWAMPSSKDYDKLLVESEYAAWTLVHGYALNHTAISVHRMAGFASGDMHEFARRLSMEVPMNKEGGLIKISPDGLLLQCSTLATTVPITFSDGGERHVAGPYIEFVERKPRAELAHIPRGQLTEAQLRDGFEVGNADKIFESTSAPAS